MLVLVCFLLQIVAFYFLYSCSARIKQNRGRAGAFLFQHKKFAKTAAVLIIIGSTLLLGSSFSPSISIMIGLSSLMTVFSVLVIAVPFFSDKKTDVINAGKS